MVRDMLTRLEIDGFKTFEDFAVDLAPFTLIVGSNAAGKSNLFDAVQLLSNLATRDIRHAMQDLRGEPLELFRLTPSGPVTQMRLAAEVLLDPRIRDPYGSEDDLKHTRIRYELTLERRRDSRGIERIQAAHESARPISVGDDLWAKSIRPSQSFREQALLYSGRRTAFLSTDTEDGRQVFNLHQDGHQGRKRSSPAGAAEATVLFGVTNTEFPHLFALREEMRNWRLLQLDPMRLRRAAPVTAADVLDADGANLAAVLARLKAETADGNRPAGVLHDIAVELHALVPDVAALDAVLDDSGREYRVDLTMRDGLPFSSRVVSDGTLRVLALLTLLHDPQHRGLVCFEEPENGVHPARVRALVERLRELVTDPSIQVEGVGGVEEQQAAEEPAGRTPEPLSQLLIASHSPVVLSAMLRGRRAVDGTVLFADSTSVSDPTRGEARRRTRLRPVRADRQVSLLDPDEHPEAFVTDFEVRKVLETVGGGIQG